MKFFRFILALGGVTVLAFGCGGPTGNQVHVRVPTRVRIDLKQFDQIFVAKFLVRESYEGVIKDQRTDYAEELQSMIRNEVQSYINRQVIDLDPAVVEYLNPPKRHARGARTEVGRTSARLAAESVHMPDPSFWSNIEQVLAFEKQYIFPEIDTYETERERVAAAPLFTYFDVPQNPRRALIFGFLSIRAVDRTYEVTQQTIPEGFSARPRTLPAGYAKAEFIIGLHFIVTDVDQEKVLYSEFREENFILPGADQMELGIFYGMMDRIMPHILSAIVPIYVNTQRFIIDHPSKERS